MGDNSKHDDILFSVLTECKTLPNFLDTVFGFLNRRTDFYCLASGPNSTVGLPAGCAENFTKQAFYNWQPKSSPPEEDTVIANIAELAAITLNEASTGAARKQAIKPSFNPSESFNGSTFDRYSWSQTIGDLDIIIKIPAGTPRRNLSVNIQSQKIGVKVKDSQEVVLEGDLCHKVKHHDALWSISDQNLEIHVEKTSEIWWSCLMQNEPKLDFNKIDCTRPYEELPDYDQAKIEKLTWNYERKRLGLPTSDELIMQKQLKEAWNLEGSPFTGPYDPSTVLLN